MASVVLPAAVSPNSQRRRLAQVAPSPPVERLRSRTPGDDSQSDEDATGAEDLAGAGSGGDPSVSGAAGSGSAVSDGPPAERAAAAARAAPSAPRLRGGLPEVDRHGGGLTTTRCVRVCVSACVCARVCVSRLSSASHFLIQHCGEQLQSLDRWCHHGYGVASLSLSL